MTAPRNRTLQLSLDEERLFHEHLVRLSGPVTADEIVGWTINGDFFESLKWLPRAFVDLLILDPPYNLTKSFNGAVFRGRALSDYASWFDSWFPHALELLKPTASVYICGDWHSSSAIHYIANKYLKVRSRITWEREKGRGASSNWKNCSEDIWFCTVSDEFTFHVDNVKLKRRVIAPYTDQNHNPKGWSKSTGGNFRLTHPSNLWTDITVPFWSMPENTNHPTQKPEKLLAKLILASSNPGEFVFDPFLGSGTTSVVAKKLGRAFAGIELDPYYCCLTAKRLELAIHDSAIQGYEDGTFWERNSAPTHITRSKAQAQIRSLFDAE
jgi:site-specific DNA-methyltransferase (adenine-specific)